MYIFHNIQMFLFVFIWAFSSPQLVGAECESLYPGGLMKRLSSV